MIPDPDFLDALLRPWTDQRTTGGRPDLPAFLVCAPRGCDLSTKLSTYCEAWERRNLAPVAHLDGRSLEEDARPHAVALLLTWPLGRAIPKLGKLRFPRFLTGLAAARVPVSTNSSQARTDIKRIISGHRDAPPPWLSDLVEKAAASTGIPVPGGAGQMAGALYGAARGWITRRSAGVAWYRSGLGVLYANPYEGLAELSRREANGDPSVDAILCRAFKADIRAAYDSRWRWFARNYNPTLFIDNAARPAAAKFLEHLVETDGPAPLTVVAASETRQKLPGSASHDYDPTPLDRAAIEDWEAKAGRPGWKRRYPTVVGWAPEPKPGGLWIRDEPRDAADVLLDRLAAGHPGARRQLQVIMDTAAPPDLRGILDGALGEQLVADVLGWVRGPYRGITDTVAVRLALLPDLTFVPDAITRVSPHPGSITAFVHGDASDLWVARSATGALRMHPLARRTLALRLGRTQGSGLSWKSCHEELRDEAADPNVVLYHSLALGEVRTVAGELSATLVEDPPDEWYRQLLAVTEAPVQAPGTDHENALEHRDALVAAGGGNGHTLVPPDLVAALQLHTDPLGDPHHQLCDGIATHLFKLASGPAERRQLLKARAEEFRACSMSWKVRGGNDVESTS